MKNGRGWVPFGRDDHYGKYEFGREPVWFNEWRVKKISQVRAAQDRRAARFAEDLRAWAVAAAPETVGEARLMIERAQAAGAIERLPLAGNKWLHRQLAAAGLALPRPSARGFRMSQRDRDALDTMPLRRSVSRYDWVSLDDMYRFFGNWSRRVDPELSVRIGANKLSAWLVSKGYEKGRRACGVVFLRLLAPKG